MKKIIAAVLFSTASMAAMAAEQGGYIAVDTGPATYNGANFAGSNSNVSFLNPGALHIGGGYHFTPNVGIEAGLVKVGDSTVNTYGIGGSATETLKSSATYLAATGIWAVGNKFDLFGKVGLAGVKMDYTYTGTLFGAPYSVSGSKTNLMFGLGGQYNFNSHFGLRVQYENFGKTDLAFRAGWVAAAATTKSVGLSTVSVGAVFNF